MLVDLIQEEIKKALRQGQAERVAALRFLWADIKNLRIDKRADLTDEEVLKIVSSQVKKRKESIEIFEKAGRLELAEKEKAGMAVLESFLPEQLTEAEVLMVVKSVLAELGDEDRKEMGKVMKLVMVKLAGKVEGGVVAALVKKEIN